jgi:hypothetical protein
MFILNKQEWIELITNCDMLPVNIRHMPSPPFAFAEQGVTMLSSVLKSKKAIIVNLSIMRAFVRLKCNCGYFRYQNKTRNNTFTFK